MNLFFFFWYFRNDRQDYLFNFWTMFFVNEILNNIKDKHFFMYPLPTKYLIYNVFENSKFLCIWPFNVSFQCKKPAAISIVEEKLSSWIALAKFKGDLSASQLSVWVFYFITKVSSCSFERFGITWCGTEHSINFWMRGLLWGQHDYFFLNYLLTNYYWIFEYLWITD